ncbi:MAG: VOC family protein [Bacteroidota bacterium]
MKAIIPYLVFSGNCREAMNYYKEVFDGEITMMKTFGESPMPVPDELSDRIFNSILVAGDFKMKASDDMPGYEVKQGTNISLFLTMKSEEEQRRIFDELSKEGKIQFPIEDNFGMVKDKYGIQWMMIHE